MTTLRFYAARNPPEALGELGLADTGKPVMCIGMRARSPMAISWTKCLNVITVAVVKQRGKRHCLSEAEPGRSQAQPRSSFRHRGIGFGLTAVELRPSAPIQEVAMADPSRRDSSRAIRACPAWSASSSWTAPANGCSRSSQNR